MGLALGYLFLQVTNVELMDRITVDPEVAFGKPVVRQCHQAKNF
jgi:hypothetical protein